LTRQDEVLASVVAWKEAPWPALEGAVRVQGPAWIHSLRSSVELDLAWCRPVEGHLEVVRLSRLRPRRPGRPCLGVAVVAAGGAFERWRLHVGDQLTIEGAP
jgi:hypothetical protein